MNIRIAVLFAAFALAAATPALSFSMLTKDGAWHEKITREALATTLQKDTLGQLAGSRGALGATGAPDIDAPFKDAAHCDNADAFSAAGYPQTAVEARAMLDACRKYAFDRIEDAVRDLAALVTKEGKVVSSQFPSLVSCTFAGDVRGRAKCNVLQNLGKAMHAAQDFYSHSNWVDQPAVGGATAQNPQGLGQSGAAPYFAAPAAAFPAGLISGCFDLKSAQSKLSGDAAETKGCNYKGGLRIKHAFLNKDDPATPRAAIGGNFERARTAAVEDTRGKWVWFEMRVREVYPGKRGAVMICAMKTDKAGTCDY